MYTLYSNTTINWNATGHERILQNVINILNTFKYEIAYDRLFGRDSENIDKPFNQSKDLIIAEMYELINEYEPRVNIKNISVFKDSDEIIIKVVVDIE